jgi:hypothetical protein
MTKMNLEMSFEVVNLHIDNMDEVINYVEKCLRHYAKVKYEKEYNAGHRHFGAGIHFNLIGKSAKFV